MNARNSLFYFAVVSALAGVLVAGPALAARDWFDVPVFNAAENMLTDMPDDYYAVKPVPAEKLMAAEGALVIDVREPKEFEVEHLAGAKNIPIRQLTSLIDTLPNETDAPILIYCRTGHRGAIGLAVLRMLGYTNVRSISGGLEAWKAAGLPITK